MSFLSELFKSHPLRPPVIPQEIRTRLSVGLISDGGGLSYGPSHPRVKISFGSQPIEEATFQYFCDSEGKVTVELFPSGKFTIYPLAEGFEGSSFQVVMPHDDQILIEMSKVNGQPIGLSRLRADKFGFQNDKGERVFLGGLSAFQHYEKFLEGEDIRPLLQQARDLGANTLRVFGMAHYIPVNAGRRPFNPSNYGDRYFDEIPTFCNLAASYGLYVYWSVFPDAELIGIADKRGFFNRVVEKLKSSSNTLGELTNEQDAHSFNSVDPRSVDRPSGIAFCSGSYGDIGGLQPQSWDFCDYHLPRGYPKHIKDANVVDHPNYIQENKGILLGEPDRFGTGGNLDQNQARLSAGACRETSLGMIVHTTQGRESTLYDEQTADIARISLKALLGSA